MEELSKRDNNVIREREVTLLHFRGWPDLDVPQEADEVIGFSELVRQLTNFHVKSSDGRALVHCRQGHGRTGTLLTILSRLLQMYHCTEQAITLEETLVNLRS